MSTFFRKLPVQILTAFSNLRHRQGGHLRDLSSLKSVVLLATIAYAAQAQASFEYYRDVYGDGRSVGWTHHNYPSKASAEDAARVACSVGTKVSRIGQFYYGRLIAQWPYQCGNGSVRQTKPPVEGWQIEFYLPTWGTTMTVDACRESTAKYVVSAVLNALERQGIPSWLAQRYYVRVTRKQYPGDRYYCDSQGLVRSR